MPAGEAESDPRWIAANDTAAKALAVQDELAVKLLRPSTAPPRSSPIMSVS